MDFNYIEELVNKIKNGDSLSKELLINEFDPFIKNLCKKTFVDGYEFEDLKEECYISLFKAINKYNTENHRFVAYGTKAIKSSIYSLIRKRNSLKTIDGTSSLWESTDMEYFSTPSNESVDSNLILFHKKDSIKKAISQLSIEEKEILINTVLKKNNTKNFSRLKKVSYSTLLRKRTKIINQLSNSVKDDFLN